VLQVGRSGANPAQIGPKDLVWLDSLGRVLQEKCKRLSVTYLEGWTGEIGFSWSKLV
jgi:hypothetical protein